ncbi:MAG TPA: hypothetical protein PKO07_22205 [Pseudomonadota bacterium]|jgi:hypothetical protein|nr:hypothetical protein [Pseudomonadota bacterium]HNN53760.1 hypothetical protein [Pseudomonadota bacterium]
MIQKTPSHNTLSRRAFGLTLVAGLCAAVTAHAADGPLQLAFYAPSAPLPSAEARYAFTEKLAQALQSSGLQVQTKIFAKPGDFEAAIKKGAVDLAILDAVYAAERGNWNVLGIATASGDAYLRWGLYTHESSGNILDMAGKRLAWVAPGGKDPTYIGNVLLYGELKASFFQLRPAAPDISAAVSEVVLRRADCVFAPEPAVSGKSLRKVYDAGEVGRIPNPVLVQVSPRVTDAIAATVRKAAGSFNTTGVLDGFRTTAQAGEAIRSVRVRLRGRPERSLVLAEPSRLNTQVASTMVSAPELPPQSLPLRTLLSAGEGIP